MKNRAKDRSGRSSQAAATRTFPKASIYDFYRPTLLGLTDEAAHRARFKRVSHCFAPALLPDLERVMRTEIARVLRILEERRGTKCDVHPLSRYYTLDKSGMIVLQSWPAAVFFQSAASLHSMTRLYFNHCSFMRFQSVLQSSRAALCLICLELRPYASPKCCVTSP